jgi:alkylated DNA nucleotide flippase Atl1
MSRRDELFEIVRLVPKGAAVGYGVVGSLLTPPVSGLIAGKWMDQCPPGGEVPWWRVVGGDGSLKIARKSPELALEQRKRLEREGVEFCEDCVRREFLISGDELLALIESSRS